MKKHSNKHIERRETTIKIENVEEALKKEGFFLTRVTTETRHYRKAYIHIILVKNKKGKTRITSHVDKEPHKQQVEPPPKGLTDQILIKANAIQQKKNIARRKSA
jgi:hypothetical protein